MTSLSISQQVTPHLSSSRGLRVRRMIGSILLHLLLILVGLAFLVPFYWMLISSFRPLSEFYKLPIPLIPDHLALQNYYDLFVKAKFARGAFNTLFIATIAVITQVFFCSLAGYTFAKLKFEGREWLFIVVLATMMIPGGVRMIPNFMIMSWIRWVDTYLPLLIPPIANAFGIFWMRQYCQSVLDELLDAARIDGASEFGIFWRVVMPVIQPGMVSLAIFIFLGTWNDFLGPLIYLRTAEKYTIQLWLSAISRQSNVFQPHLIMAGSVLSSIPIIILFAFMQRYFVAGLTTGAIK